MTHQPATNSGGASASVERSRRLSRGKRLLYTILTIVAALLLVEIGARILAPEYTNLRFSTEVTCGHPIGPRGADFGAAVAREPREPGEVRILMIGDSVMWGYGLPIEDTISAQTEAKLRCLRPERRWRCINFAGMGNTPRLRHDFDMEQLKSLPIDAVVYQFNLNDVAWEDDESLRMTPDPHVGFLKGLLSNNLYGLRSRYLRYSTFLGYIEYKSKLNAYAARKPIDPASSVAGMAAYCDSEAIRKRWDRQFQALAELKQLCDARKIGFFVYMSPTAEAISNDPRDNPFNVDKSKFTVDPFKRFDEYCAKYGLSGHQLLANYKSERDAMLAGRVPYDRLFFQQLADTAHLDKRGAEIFADAIVADILAGRVLWSATSSRSAADQPHAARARS